MQCPICRGNENWENVDRFRIKPEGMSLCRNCGFISYPNRYKTKAEIIKYYEDEYRRPPGASNIFTGERKLHYHAHFLHDLLNQWKQSGNEEPVYCDVGAAIGMTLNWLRGHFPKAKLHGVELTKTFVRNAWHLFNVKLDQDFDDTIQYDLITSYKSLEHILDPDVELRRYIKALKPNGHLYISVPMWFNELKNFGVGGFDIEYYYSPDHINTWNEAQFEALVGVCGGRIVKTNRTYYGVSYLVQRDDDLKVDRQACFQNPDEILKNLETVFHANEAYQTNNFSEAIARWPNFPSAHFNDYEIRRKEHHGKGWDHIYKNVIERALEMCPDDAEIHRFAAELCMRYEQYELALEHLAKRNELQPQHPETFSLFGACFREMSKRSKDPESRIKFLEEAKKVTEVFKQVSSQNYAEGMNWIMLDNSKIPTPFEARQ